MTGYGKSKNLVMKDWAGNEIKAGDTIVSVSIKPGAMFGPITKVFPDGSRITYPEPDYTNFWSPGYEMKVVEMDGKLYKVLKSMHGLFSFPLNDSTKDWNDREILCIKGVSDNKEMYYKSL